MADINVGVRQPWDRRTTKVLATLREDNYWNAARKRVMTWLRQAMGDWDMAIDGKIVVVGEVSKTTHHSWDNVYKEALHNSQIIVTCNPATWEGDQVNLLSYIYFLLLTAVSSVRGKHSPVVPWYLLIECSPRTPIPC